MPQPRELTDRYRLEKILRSGRDATVLRANDSQSAQAVIVKLITTGDSVGQAEGFAQFARAFAAIRHPNLPRVLDGGLTTDGSSFLVLELLSGIGVDTLVGGSPDRLLPLLAQAASGLEAMAQRGIAHHNLSTDNLFLSSSLSGERVKILGLGRAALGPIPHPEGDAARFRAPELDQPNGRADWRADIYSLAVVACHLLGATIAMGDSNEIAVQMPLALSFDLANDEALRRILERCLQREPLLRPSHLEIREGFRIAGGRSEQEAAEAAATGEDTRPPLGSPARFAPAAAAGPAHGEAPLAHVIPISSAGRPDLSRTVAPDDEPFEQHFLTSAKSPASVPPPAPEPTPLQLSALQAPDLPHLEPTLLRPAASSLSPAPAAPEVPHEPSLRFDPSVDGIHLGGLDEDPGPRQPSLAEQLANQPDEEHFLPVGGFPETALEAIRPAGVAEPPIDAAALTVPTKIRPSQTADEAPLLAAQFLAALNAGNDAKPATAARPVTTPPTRLPTGTLSVPPPPRIEPPPLRPPGTFPPKGPASSTWAEAEPRPNPPALPLSAPSAESKPAEESGSLLSLDEDLLKVLAAPPPDAAPPPPTKGRRGATSARTAAPAKAGTTTGAQPIAAGARSGGLSALPKPLLWGGLGGLVVLLAAGAYFIAGRAGSPPPPPAMSDEPAPAAAPPPPTEEAKTKLAAALAFLEDGRDGDSRLRSGIDALTNTEIAALPAADCARVDTIRYALALEQREALPSELPAALKAGDLAHLESLMSIGSVNDMPPKLRADFVKAQNLVTLYRQAEAAAAAGHPLEVLQHFAALQRAQRGLRDEHQLQAQAAAAIEKEADGLGHDGKYDEALARLEGLAAAWPERSGIKDLLQSYRQYAADEAKQQQFLVTLPSYERRRKPSEALDVFREIKPTPHLAAQLEEGRKRLEAQLAVLDAQAPQVTLRDGYQLQYSRGMTVELSFRVTDDYQVKTVKLNVRNEGGHWQELPLERDSFSYTVQIPPTVHKNSTVAFYVVATDLSGHEGTLGSKEKPLQLTRMGSERLLR